METIKVSIKAFFRQFDLLKIADTIHYFWNLLTTWQIRRIFRQQNPNVAIPPPYYIYETYHLNIFSYYNGGLKTAEWLIEHLEQYINMEDAIILDWGCGAGRVIRHLPKLLPSECEVYGCDYNEKYINWCLKNVSNVKFFKNRLHPPLQIERDYFDCIFGISIFTHLSKNMHFAWFEELIRVLRPGGVLFLTFQGNAFRNKLTDYEKKGFDQGELIVKPSTTEGHRTYSSFQPHTFVLNLIGSHTLLNHIPGEINNNKQDIYIIQALNEESQ